MAWRLLVLTSGPVAVGIGPKYDWCVSERFSVDALSASVAGGRSRLAVLWSFVGAALAFALSVFVPPVAFGAGVLLVAVALRRGLVGFGMFTVGFVVWCAVYTGLAVVGAFT